METNSPALDITNFMVSAIHDMKNSVNLLNAYLEHALSHNSGNTPEQQLKTAQMLYETKRVNANLIQLLCVYKLNNQHYPFDVSAQNIGDFMQETVAQASPLLQFHHIELEQHYDADAEAYFDRELIQGVINQALNNAVRYARGNIRLAATRDHRGLEIRVEDNGPGYPEHLLNPATSLAQNPVNMNTGSTGLGLYFAQLVASQHQHRGQSGSIRLENGGHYGGGCFVLCLP
jgi:two-component system sensor histidine kinase SenX3